MHKKWLEIVLTCAWILWLNDLLLSNPADKWSPQTPHETQAECESAKARTIERYRQTTESLDDAGVRGDIIKFGKAMFTFQCWPDTIDPRRPK